MTRSAYLAYGAVCYVGFLAVFTYAIGFVGNLPVSKGIDSGTEGPVGGAVLFNVLLLGLFGLQHSIMARPRFKAWWTRIIPQPIERSTFVLCTNVVLVLLFHQWRPMKTVVWAIESSMLRSTMIGLSLGGFLLVVYATFLIDHFDLFGLRQVWLHFQGRPYTHKTFRTPALYRMIRHPIMLGFLIAFWSTPVMTQGHLLFSLVTTGYIFVGIALEERDLAAHFGKDYEQYRKRTSMLIPLFRGS